MMNLDGAGLQIDSLAVTRQIIGPLALHLDGRILRRDLLDKPGKTRQQGSDRLAGGSDVAGPHDPAFGIVGVTLLAPAYCEAVALAAVHDERDRLGGLAQRNRQAA